MEIPDKPDYHARTCRPDGGCGESVSRANAPEAEMRCPDRPPALKWASCQLMMESRRRGYRAQNT